MKKPKHQKAITISLGRSNLSFAGRQHSGEGKRDISVEEVRDIGHKNVDYVGICNYGSW